MSRTGSERQRTGSNRHACCREVARRTLDPVPRDIEHIDARVEAFPDLFEQVRTRGRPCLRRR
jgi:hypothetical protein